MLVLQREPTLRMEKRLHLLRAAPWGGGGPSFDCTWERQSELPRGGTECMGRSESPGPGNCASTG